MSSEASEREQAIVVLTQAELDTAIHAIEAASIGMTDEQFRDAYGDVYKKLHAIDRAEDPSYRVK
jgi:hypothetical protein